RAPSYCGWAVWAFAVMEVPARLASMSAPASTRALVRTFSIENMLRSPRCRARCSPPERSAESERSLPFTEATNLRGGIRQSPENWRPSAAMLARTNGNAGQRPAFHDLDFLGRWLVPH